MQFPALHFHFGRFWHFYHSLTVYAEHVTAHVTAVNLPHSLQNRYARQVSQKPQVNEK
jgi:hypothetical protein